MHIDNDSIKATRFHLVSRGGEVPHRAWVIMDAAELESLLGERFISWLAGINPTLDREKAKYDLIDNGSLGSLTKLADMTYHVGLIGNHMRHDLRKIAKLRDRYAHDFNIGQLDAEPTIFKIISDTFLYKQNHHMLQSIEHLPHQSAFIAIAAQLKKAIIDGVVE